MTDENDGAFLIALTIALFILVLVGFATSSPVRSEETPLSPFICMGPGDDCTTRLIRLPDGLEGQVLKFEFCKEGDCDRAQRERWGTHYLVPPPGEVCHNTDVTEALHWLEQNRPGWLLAGWGCVSSRKVAV